MLATRRLILRSWRSADRLPFRDLNADPEVTRFLPGPYSAADSDAQADALEAGVEQHGWGFWAVEVKGGAPFIGFVGLRRNDGLPIGHCHELGWRLARAHWGKGYATEAAQAAMTFGFGRLCLTEIVAITMPANGRSRAVMERLGMAHDRGGDFDHPALPPAHPLRRHVLYRMKAP